MYIKKDWKCCKEYDGSFNIIKCPPEFKHHSKAVCSHCNHFQKWLPNPKTLELVEENNTKVKEIKKHIEKLVDYEISFVNDMENKKKISPKQQKYLNDLYEKIVV